jgi:hypothetical protein
LSYQESVCKRIAKIKEVDASFIVPDESGTVHVYSVVEEYGDFYDRLIRQERLIEKDCPGISFDFHVRARQSREPFQVAPIDAHPVFVR